MFKNIKTAEQVQAEKLEQSKAQALNQARQVYEQSIKDLTGDVPHTEIASWTKQESEARALLQDSTVSTPFLDLLVDSRGLGETKSELADKVIANADAYTQGAARLLGEYQASVRNIKNGLV